MPFSFNIQDTLLSIFHFFPFLLNNMVMTLYFCLKFHLSTHCLQIYLSYPLIERCLKFVLQTFPRFLCFKSFRQCDPQLRKKLFEKKYTADITLLSAVALIQIVSPSLQLPGLFYNSVSFKSIYILAHVIKRAK